MFGVSPVSIFKMCGIFAVFGLPESSSKFRNDVLRYSKLLRHRGPDWNGIACFRNCILTHERYVSFIIVLMRISVANFVNFNRLAIVGLNSGAQPIVDNDGDVAMSVNGEIYNHEELEKWLKRQNPNLFDAFTTDSDCEVLLHLYKETGTDFLEKNMVNGMYAFVLYDKMKDEYLVARDPIGIIPLYIGYGVDGSVWFSSEMKAMQDNCSHYEIFPPGHYYLGLCDFTKFSRFSWISMDEIDFAGKSFQGDMKAEMKQFYNQRWFVDQDYIPNEAFDLDVFRENFSASVRRHLLAEVPFGLLLSGGLDSSLVASIACREYKKLGNHDVLKSFCIGNEINFCLKDLRETASFFSK